MKIAVVGAGIGGMAAAYDLVRENHEVTIYEAASYVGGLASGFKEPHWDWSVERFYHHWFASDQAILGLLEEVGLSHKVIFPRPYTVVYHQGKWYPFDSILMALKFPGLGWGLNKIRFGLVGLYLRLTNNWQSLEKTTVEKWMRKWAGSEVYEKMWKSLVDGKFGPYSDQVNMAWMWARMKARTTKLGTYQGGFQQFADDFSVHIQRLGVTLHLNTPVLSIHPENSASKLVLSFDGQPSAEFDQVLVTTSPNLFTKMTPGLPDTYLAGLNALKSMGAVVMVFSFKYRLSEEGYYWFNIPKDAGFPYLALVEHTNFVSPKNFGGDHIIYCGDYLPTDHRFFSLSKEDIQEIYASAFPKFNKKFQTDWIKKTWLYRTKYAQPIPLINHSSQIPDIQTPIPGLFFASMSQIYPWDRGTNFAVEIGRKAAGMMTKSSN